MDTTVILITLAWMALTGYFYEKWKHKEKFGTVMFFILTFPFVIPFTIGERLAEYERKQHKN